MIGKGTWRPWSDLTDSARRRRSEEAEWATLQRSADTPAAQRLSASLLETYILPAKRARRSYAIGAKTLADLEYATGAIAADLLHAASKRRAVKRSVVRGAFKEAPVSWTDWQDVMGPLVAAGLVERAPGFKELGSYSRPRAPIFCATPRLVALAAEHGVELKTAPRSTLPERRKAASGPGEGHRESISVEELPW